MSETWLAEFHGQRITVLSSVGDEERNDTGTLVRLGDGWLQLAKDNGEMVLFPHTAVRIVKLLEQTQTVPAIARRQPPTVVDPPAQIIS